MLAGQVSWAQSCGNITGVGCCSGTTAKYCSSGVLKTKDCAKDTKYGPNCGWVASQKFYSCSKTAGSDPAGLKIRDCAKQPDAGGGSKKDAGSSSKDYGPKVPCGKIGSKGCCDGETLKYCYNGSLATKNCTTSKDGPKCGWSTTKSYYTCGTTGLSDPKGSYPKACSGSSTKDSGGSTKKDQGSTAKKDHGGLATPDKGTSTKQDSSINPIKKEDSGSCNLSGQDSGSGLALALALMALALLRRRS